MGTVKAMLRRILTLAAGALVGVLACLGAVRVVHAWSLLPGHDPLDRSAAYVRDVMKIVSESYVDEAAAAPDKLTHLALHGMVESLDPHSEFLESEDNKEFKEDLDGEFGGIGIEVETRHDRVVVIAPIAGSPGEKAGILRGDEIRSIDGHPVERGSGMDAVVDRLRGRAGTPVSLTVYRPSSARLLDFHLRREIVKIESVRGARVIEGGIGYVQVTEFSEHTGEQFDDAVNRLLKQGIDSLIIDLRNNPGGLIDAAVEVAEPFFAKNELVVYTQGRKPSDREEYRAEGDGEPLRIPLAVLVNGGSASAAEIVTGALKDTGRAVVVGERTFGKGSVQTNIDLKNGEGLRLTIAHYFTPSGVTIHEKGVSPDVEVVMTAAEDEKLRQQTSRPDLEDPADVQDRFGFLPIEDRQLDAAVDVLRGVRLVDADADALAARAHPAEAAH